MTRPQKSIRLHSTDDTERLARQIGARLAPGDCLLLKGPIGAGKTHFARHLIQSLQDMPEDVPSPTFTLIQTYDTAGGEVWHADLYRLTTLDELEELGLAEAFEEAICIVEWPDRMAGLAPVSALHLNLQPDPSADDIRDLTLSWSDPKWTTKLDISEDA